MTKAKKETPKTISKKIEKEVKKETPKPKVKRIYEVTYEPGFSASQVYVLKLTKDEIQSVNGKDERVKVPMFKSLPSKIRINRGEVIELTKEQYDDLRSINQIETRKEREERLKKSDDVPKQSGVDPQTLQHNKISKFYKDVLVDIEE